MDKIHNIGGMVSSSALMSNMLIFSDPIFLYISIMGAIISALGLIHEVLENRDEFDNFRHIIGELIKAILFGAILTPIFFIFLLKAGDKVILPMFGINSVNMLNSFWLLIAILASWYALPLWDIILKTIIRRFKKNGE